LTTLDSLRKTRKVKKNEQLIPNTQKGIANDEDHKSLDIGNSLLDIGFSKIFILNVRHAVSFYIQHVKESPVPLTNTGGLLWQRLI
jgi:hypothetical protein